MDGHRLAVAQECHGDYIARTMTTDMFLQVGAGLDSRIVNTRDHIAALDACFLCRAIRHNTLHVRPLEGCQVFLFLQFGSDLTHLYAEDSALYDTVLADVAHYFLHDTGRHCKTVARIRTGLRSDSGVDTHQLAARVNQRTAGVAGIDGCVGLDERLNLHLRVKDIDVTRLGGHDTRCDGRS